MSFKKLLRRRKNTVKIPLVVSDKSRPSKLTYEDLVNAEAELGRTIFGDIPAGHQREFFSYKKNVWLWYEKYIDESGNPKEMTIRYEVRPTGVFKRASGCSYTKIEGAELKNFQTAVKNYFALVKSKLYS